MKTPTKAESIGKLAQWCVENSSETFSAFFDWSAHIGGVKIDIYGNGWGANSSVSDNFELSLNRHESAYIEEWVKMAIIQLEKLLAESNKRNSPENAAKLQVERDAKELAKAKAVIARLESE